MWLWRPQPGRDCRFGKLTTGRWKIEAMADDFPNASKVEIEEKVTKLRKRLEEEGPYDIVLGFSQGLKGC